MQALPGPGRPSKRTPEAEAKILNALRGGCTRKAACGYGGISEDTFARWLADEDFADFADKVTQAENEAEAIFTGVLFEAAKKDWRAAESWLKRRRRAEWGDNVKAEVSGPDGGPIPTMETPEELRKLPADELVRRYRESLRNPGPTK